MPNVLRIKIDDDTVLCSETMLVMMFCLSISDSSLKIAREDVRKSLSFAVYFTHADLLQITSGGVWQSRELQTSKL